MPRIENAAASTVLDYANWPALVRALPFTDPELIAFFADAVPPAIASLKAHGVKFGGIGFYGHTPRASPRIAITGGGLHLIEVMTARAETIGVQFFYETSAQALLQSANGAVCGMRAGSKTGGARISRR
jgi:tricarballylate dehydrogenase